jgi:two-component system OmpR family sensor kinase
MAVRTGVYLAAVLLVILLAFYFSVAWLLNKNADANLLVNAHGITAQWMQKGGIEPFPWDNGFYRVFDANGRYLLEHGIHKENRHEKEERMKEEWMTEEWLTGETDRREPVFSYRLEKNEQPKTGWKAGWYEILPFQRGYREVYVPFTLQSNGYMLELARESEETQELLGGILLLLASIAGGGLIVISSVVAFSSREGFRPVREIAQTVRTIEERTLSTRLQIPVRDKTLSELVGGLNGMLDRLDRAFQAQNRFVQDASHELRTPLAVLRSDIEIALRRTRTEAEYKTTLQRCLEEVDHMTHMSNQLLTLAKYEQSPNLERRPIVLAEVVERAIQQSQRTIPADTVHIQKDFKETGEIMGEPVALEMVFANLIQNAIRAVGRHGTIRVTIARQGAWVVTEIADNGPGIPEEKIPNLFERFYRLDESRNRQSGGTGLGLAIAHSIVEAHRGTIEVKSRVGEGTVFAVRLPSR